MIKTLNVQVTVRAVNVHENDFSCIRRFVQITMCMGVPNAANLTGWTAPIIWSARTLAIQVMVHSDCNLEGHYKARLGCQKCHLRHLSSLP